MSLSSAMTAHIHPELVLLILLLQLKHQGLAQGFLLEEKGTLETEDRRRMYYVGENLTLHCHKNVNFTGDVHFTAGNLIIPNEFVVQHSSRHAHMTKPITGADFKKATYQCLDDSLIAFLSHIYTDYPPQKATNLQVVWQNKTDVHTSWDFGGVHYKNIPSVSHITATWATSTENEGNWKACTAQRNQSCTIAGFTERDATLLVRVNASNMMRGDSAVHVFPAVPLNLHGELRSDGFLKVTGMTASRTWHISGLHPSYTYRFDVRARFEQGYLSDPPTTITTLLMPEDAPASGPVLLPAGYYLDDSLCSPRHNGSAATAYVYFQDIPEEDQNGIIQNYTAQVSTLAVTDTVGRRDARTFTLEGVPCDRSFVVTVFGSTDVGRSPSASLSVFPRRPDMERAVENLKLKIRVTERAGDVWAEWLPPLSSSNLSLFLYFCERGADNDQFQYAAQYVEVNASAGQHRLKGATPVMKFGAAVMTADSLSSGIHFTDCLYNPGLGAGKPPKNLEVYGQNGDLEVHWHGQRCNALRRVIILNYDLEVCKAPLFTQCWKYRVEGNRFQYRVGDLTPGGSYRVRIRGSTTSRPQSLTPFSDLVQVTLPSRESAGSTGVIVGVVVGLLVVLVGSGVLCYCVFREKVRETRYKFKPSIDPASFQTAARDKDPSALKDGRLSKKDNNGVTNPAYIQGTSGHNNMAWGNSATEVQTGGESSAVPTSHVSADLLKATGDLTTRQCCITMAVDCLPLVVTSSVTDTRSADTPQVESAHSRPTVDMSVAMLGAPQESVVSVVDGGVGEDGCGSDGESVNEEDEEGEGGVLQVSMVERNYIERYTAVGHQWDASTPCCPGPASVGLHLSDSLTPVQQLGRDSSSAAGLNNPSVGSDSQMTAGDTLRFAHHSGSVALVRNHPWSGADVKTEVDGGQCAQAGCTAQSEAEAAVVSSVPEEGNKSKEQSAGEDGHAVKPDSSESLLHRGLLTPPHSSQLEPSTATGSASYVLLPPSPGLSQPSFTAEDCQMDWREEEDDLDFTDEMDDNPCEDVDERPVDAHALACPGLQPSLKSESHAEAFSASVVDSATCVTDTDVEETPLTALDSATCVTDTDVEETPLTALDSATCVTDTDVEETPLTAVDQGGGAVDDLGPERPEDSVSPADEGGPARGGLSQATVSPAVSQPLCSAYLPLTGCMETKGQGPQQGLEPHRAEGDPPQSSLTPHSHGPRAEPVPSDFSIPHSLCTSPPTGTTSYVSHLSLERQDNSLPSDSKSGMTDHSSKSGTTGYVFHSSLPSDSKSGTTGYSSQPSDSKSGTTGYSSQPSDSKSGTTGYSCLPSDSKSGTTGYSSLPSDSKSGTGYVSHSCLPSDSKSGTTGYSSLPSDSKSGTTGYSSLPSDSKSGTTGYSSLPSDSKSGTTGYSSLPSDSKSGTTGYSSLPSDFKSGTTGCVSHSSLPSYSKSGTTGYVSHSCLPSDSKSGTTGYSSLPSDSKSGTTGYSSLPSDSKSGMTGYVSHSSQPSDSLQDSSFPHCSVLTSTTAQTNNPVPQNLPKDRNSMELQHADSAALPAAQDSAICSTGVSQSPSRTPAHVMTTPGRHGPQETNGLDVGQNEDEQNPDWVRLDSGYCSSPSFDSIHPNFHKLKLWESDGDCMFTLDKTTVDTDSDETAEDDQSPEDLQFTGTSMSPLGYVTLKNSNLTSPMPVAPSATSPTSIFQPS
ncbi:uncharacterized protein LOC143280372 [Babylonia areolata]|uniref:uncharacterized protein LOC143280372 n=1 Tax=Babylonia areolata TaxID=304850 RepID=UPI003FD2764F